MQVVKEVFMTQVKIVEAIDSLSRRIDSLAVAFGGAPGGQARTESNEQNSAYLLQQVQKVMGNVDTLKGHVDKVQVRCSTRRA